MARVLGVRANRVIAVAFALSGMLAAAVSCLVVAQTGIVQPRMGLQLVIIAFVGTVIGGLGSLSGAALGGFLVGAATILLQALAAARPARLPRGLRLRRRDARSSLPTAGPDPGARAEGADLMSEPARGHGGAPSRRCSGYGRCSRSSAVIAAIAVAASFAPAVLQRRTTQGLINLVAVVGLYVFVGNSGVLSFGNVAFMAIGAYVSALLTMKAAAKSVFLPDLPAFIAHAEWPTLARRARRRHRGGTRRARRRLAADAPLRHLGQHRDLRRPRRHLCRARQLDLGHRRPELADGPADLCRPVDRSRLGGRGDRDRLRLSGDALGAAAARLARGRGRGRGRRRPHRPPSADRLRHQRLPLRDRRRAARPFPRHGAGRDLLSRPHLPDRGDAGDRRHVAASPARWPARSSSRR